MSQPTVLPVAFMIAPRSLWQRIAWAVLFPLLGGGNHSRAEVVMPMIFGDHMVLQRDAAVPVWGRAKAGEKVTVSLGENIASTVTKEDGRWRVNLSPGPKNEQGQILTITGETNTLSFQDVLLGDVWIASGQSNMEFGILTDRNGAEAAKTASDRQLRFFHVPVAAALDPMSDIAAVPPASLSGHWQVCTPELMGTPWAWHGFSAVGYYFAREIRHSTGAPVGMIGVYKGSTGAQAWVSLEGLGKDKALAHYLTEHETLVAAYSEAKKNYPQKQSEYAAAMRTWNAENGADYRADLARWEKDAANAQAAGSPPRQSHRPPALSPLPR